MRVTLHPVVFIVAATACVLLMACASTAAPSSSSSTSEVSPSIGWLHGGCIALSAAEVAVGTGVVLVSLDGPRQTLTSVRISEHADDVEGCPALLEDRSAANRANALSFYRVEPVPTTELAIGVLSGRSGIVDVDAVLDTNGDGRRDTFTQCSTAEGVRFSVWADKAGHGEPLWSGYYYLGYDVQPNCPEVY